VYYVLTAITLVLAAALAVWLFGPWSRPPQASTPSTDTQPSVAENAP